MTSTTDKAEREADSYSVRGRKRFHSVPYTHNYKGSPLDDLVGQALRTAANALALVALPVLM